MADLRVGVGAVRPECLKVIDWASDMVARRRGDAGTMLGDADAV